MFVWGWSTDGPECGWLANPDQPIASDDVVTYLLNRLTDGPIVCSLGRSTDSLLTMLCGLFVEPIDRWSYAIYLSSRLTDCYFSNLGRWAWELALADWPMGHTVHLPTINTKWLTHISWILQRDNYNTEYPIAYRKSLFRNIHEVQEQSRNNYTSW